MEANCGKPTVLKSDINYKPQDQILQQKILPEIFLFSAALGKLHVLETNNLKAMPHFIMKYNQ
jgi:hypothetical protein